MTVLLPVRPRSCETISIDKKSRDDLANFIFAKERAFSYYCCHYIFPEALGLIISYYKDYHTIFLDNEKVVCVKK